MSCLSFILKVQLRWIRLGGGAEGLKGRGRKGGLYRITTEANGRNVITLHWTKLAKRWQALSLSAKQSNRRQGFFFFVSRYSTILIRQESTRSVVSIQSCWKKKPNNKQNIKIPLNFVRLDVRWPDGQTNGPDEVKCASDHLSSWFQNFRADLTSGGMSACKGHDPSLLQTPTQSSKGIKRSGILPDASPQKGAIGC